MTDKQLSPAAQAVLDAVCDNTEPDCDTQHLIAAALREVINQFEIKNEIESAYFNGWNACLKDIGILCDQLDAL